MWLQVLQEIKEEREKVNYLNEIHKGKGKKTQDDRVMDAITFLWTLIAIMMMATRGLEG